MQMARKYLCCAVMISHQLIFFLTLFHYSAAAGCSNNPEFEIVGHSRSITIAAHEQSSLNVTCMINCTGFRWNGCGVEPNAFIMVPADQYSTHKVCPDPIQFNNDISGFGVIASCDRSLIPTNFCGNMEEARYNVTLSNISFSSPYKEFVIACGLTPKFYLHGQNRCQSCPVPVNGFSNSRVAINILDLEVSSYQIDQHPVIHALEGGDLKITCARLAGTEYEWKFLVEKDEFLYPEHLMILKNRGFSITPEDGGITESDSVRLQNFSITITGVLADMTGVAVYCGATVTEGNEERRVTKFHDGAAVLIIHKNVIPPSHIDTMVPITSSNAAVRNRVFIGFGSFVLIISLIVSFVVIIIIASKFIVPKYKTHTQVHPHDN